MPPFIEINIPSAIDRQKLHLDIHESFKLTAGLKHRFMFDDRGNNRYSLLSSLQSQAPKSPIDTFRRTASEDNLLRFGVHKCSDASTSILHSFRSIPPKGM